mgnify:CR=1 FL=1
MNIDYTVRTKKSFDEAVESVAAETAKAGFRVLHIHDVKETVGKKGFEIEPLKIIEICNAKNAFYALKTDIRLSLFLPCKINVYEKKGKTIISGMRPLIIKQIFPSLDIQELLQEVEVAVKTIVDRSK